MVEFLYNMTATNVTSMHKANLFGAVHVYIRRVKNRVFGTGARRLCRL